MLSALLGACGQAGDGKDNPDVADKYEAYCDEVVAQQKPISVALAGDQATALLSALPSFEKLQAESPADLVDEWAIVVRRITVLETALDDAGIDPADYDPKKTPKTLPPGQRAAIEAAATGLLSPQTAAALQGVQQEARDVCKTSLSLP